MKDTAILILAVLLAIMVYLFTKDKWDHGVEPTGPVGAPTVEPLKPEVEKLMELTNKDAVVAVVTFDGHVKLFTPSRTVHTHGELPLPTAAIRNVEAFSLVAYQGSHCLLWAPGKPGGNGVTYDKYCLAWGAH